MSAICGLISRVSDSCRSAETLRKMAQALPLHPDTGTIYTCQLQNGGFGVHQQFPLASLEADKARSLYQQPDLSIVCAAEFYNAPALRPRLAETLPPEAGAATVLAAAYRHFGPECAA